MTSPLWRARLILFLAAASLVLTGCTGTSERPPAPSPPSAGVPSDAAAQAAVDAIVRGALDDDRAAFLTQVSTRDPSFADRARLLYANLSGLPLTRLQLQLRGTRQPLPAARQQLLGDEAWRQQATATWQLEGETASAVATVWLTFLPGPSGVLLAGTLDQPDGPLSAEPIWWTGPVRAAREGVDAVLVGAGQPADVWLTRVRTAVGEVQPRVTAGTARSWTGAVVVEVPASRADFESVVGAAPGSYVDIAAVTLAEGPVATAAVRVVVNPDVTSRLTAVGVATVLTHELVHVATRSADSPAPTWAVEGLADDVAFATHPGAAAASNRLLRDRVRQHGAPAALPSDQAFGAGQPNLDLTYAEGWSVCRYVSTTWSPVALQRLYTALDDGTPLKRAAQDELGVSAARLTAGWRHWLVTQAGG